MNLDRDLNSIDEYLAGFFEDAVLDSQGKFSVDISKRLSKLSQFQLEQPEKFILALFSAAALAGASRFDLKRTASGYEVAVDRPWCASNEVDDLVAALASGGADQGNPRLRHLGMALHLLRRLHGTRVELELESEVLEVASEPCKRRRLNGPGKPTLRVRSTLFERFFSSRHAKIHRSLCDWLERRCAWATLVWSADGVAGNREPTWMKAPTARIEINGGVAGFNCPWAPLSGTLRDDALPGVRGWALLGAEESPDSWVMSAGVSYPLALKLSESVGSCQVVLWCDEVGADLSYEALMENQLQPIRERIPHWLGALEMAPVEQRWQEGGWPAVVRLPGVEQRLWRFKQRHLLSDLRLNLSWNQSFRPLYDLRLACGLKVGELMQVYRRRFGLPVTPEVGDYRLEDGSPLIPLSRDDSLTQWLFSRREHFVIWQGRPLPSQGGPFGLLDYDSYWQCTPVREYWQLGIDRHPGKYPPTLLRFQGPRFETGEDGSAVLLPGFTLAVASPHTPPRAELWGAMDSLVAQAWRDPESELSNERREALLAVWEGMRGAGEFPQTRALLEKL